MNVLKTLNLIVFRVPLCYLKLKRSYNNVACEDIPEVSSGLIKRTLSLNGCSVDEGFTCFITKCVLCNFPKTESKGKLYINKITGMYMCSCCKESGQWDQLAAHINLLKSKKSRVKEKIDHFSTLNNLNESLEQIRQSTSQLSLLDDENFLNILNKFKLPNVPLETIQALDIRINERNTRLYFPLENMENTTVGYRTLHSYPHEEEVLPHSQCGGILTAHLPRSRETALLVPNIQDFLILLNSKLPINLICLPNGVKSLSQYYLPTLERFKKLILWLGNDTNAWDSSKHFAKKLGENRCSLIRPAHLLPHIKMDQDFKEIISSAHPMLHKSITTFGSLRAEVLSELQNIDKVLGVKWKRYPKLNKLLKGHRRGELTILTGPTGSGKTTFMSEYSLDLAMQGVNTLWGSFEIRNTRLARTMLQQMAGIPLDENLHLFDQIADEFQKLPIYFMTFHGQQSIKIVMEAVLHATYIHDIGHIIIDNVQFMMGMAAENKHMDRFWMQDTIIAAFREFATKKNCHVTLVIHPRKERDEDLTTNSIFGGAKAAQEADNVLIIQDKRLSSIKGKKYLQVAKNRYSGDLGVIPLDFNKDALSYAVKKPKDESPISDKADEISES